MNKEQAQQLATQAAIEQRNQALNAVIELQVQLAMAQAEIAELKAAKADPQPEGSNKRAAEHGHG